MSVKLTLGNKLQKNQMDQDELKARLMELTENLSKAHQEIKKLNRENSEIQSTNSELTQKISEILNQNLKLNKHLESANKKQNEIESERLNLLSQNEEISQTNKLLKSEIEKLNSDLNFKAQKILNYSKEIDDVYKVKDKFEYKMIELSEENEKLKENIKIYENVLKNKDKYIEILIRKNSGGSAKITNEIDKDNYDRNKTKKVKDFNSKYRSESNFSVTSVTNVIVLQNNILELEEKLKCKDEQIKKIEMEKANLLTRIRNIAIK